MQVREIMTANPVGCTPDASLQQVATIMVDYDCGEIPVLDEQGRPIGVVTDRDITCRAVAQGRDISRTTAHEIMSSPALTVTPQTSLEECCTRMEENQIRRVPVVDASGCCCGIVSQADIARVMPDQESGHVVRNVSRPTLEASRVRSS